MKKRHMMLVLPDLTSITATKDSKLLINTMYLPHNHAQVAKADAVKTIVAETLLISDNTLMIMVKDPEA